MTFDLQSVVSSRSTFKPQRFLIYGVQGIGKSTCASTFECPIFLRLEDGLQALDVPTFPDIPQNMQEVGMALRALQGDHSFKTLVIDSIDWLEPLVWHLVCQANGLKDIEGIGYGKGYVKADAVWQGLLTLLDQLRARGMQIVLIFHHEIKTFLPPDADSYDRYQLKLHKRALSMFAEWCDNIFFINYRRRLISRDKNGDEKRAEGDGQRIIYTSEKPAFLAKNRWNLPECISIGKDILWTPLHVALHTAMGDLYPMPSALVKTVAHEQPQQPQQQ